MRGKWCEKEKTERERETMKDGQAQHLFRNNNAGSDMTNWRCRECWQAYRGPQTICLDICSVLLIRAHTPGDITHIDSHMFSGFVSRVFAVSVYTLLLCSLCCCFFLFFCSLCLKWSSSHSDRQQQGLRSLKSYTKQTEADTYPVFALPRRVYFG